MEKDECTVRVVCKCRAEVVMSSSGEREQETISCLFLVDLIIMWISEPRAFLAHWNDVLMDLGQL